MATLKINCFKCNNEMEFQDFISRREECPSCGEDVRVCKNCEFYDPKVYNECRETQSDPVQDKERSTLCDYFRPGGSGSAVGNEKDKLKSAAEALFNPKKS